VAGAAPPRCSGHSAATDAAATIASAWLAQATAAAADWAATMAKVATSATIRRNGRRAFTAAIMPDSPGTTLARPEGPAGRPAGRLAPQGGSIGVDRGRLGSERQLGSIGVRAATVPNGVRAATVPNGVSADWGQSRNWCATSVAALT